MGHSNVSYNENSYSDSNITFGNEYCYKVKAVYQEGESNPTNTECGIVTDPGDFSVVTIGSVTVESGRRTGVEVMGRPGWRKIFKQHTKYKESYVLFEKDFWFYNRKSITN